MSVLEAVMTRARRAAATLLGGVGIACLAAGVIALCSDELAHLAAGCALLAAAAAIGVWGE